MPRHILRSFAHTDSSSLNAFHFYLSFNPFTHPAHSAQILLQETFLDSPGNLQCLTWQSKIPTCMKQENTPVIKVKNQPSEIDIGVRISRQEY